MGRCHGNSTTMNYNLYWISTGNTRRPPRALVNFLEFITIFFLSLFFVFGGHVKSFL
jgi:hypothetical protein